MKIDHEVELPAADIFYDLKDSENRKWYEAVAQGDPIDLNGRICIAGHPDDFGRGLSACNRDPSVGKFFANCSQRRQAHHNVAELAEIDNQNIARIKSHFRCLSKNSAVAEYDRTQSWCRKKS